MGAPSAQRPSLEAIMTQSDFRDLLYKIKADAYSDFSGAGVIISDSPANLPIVNLRDTPPKLSGSVVGILSELSSYKSKYHDGFHILNRKGEITHVAQYFSPPIIKEVRIDNVRPVGGRFVAALFGSAIPDVIMTGVISERHGLSIFVDGKEVYFEEAQ
ncbi:hypothetical protein [Shewanella xiamenensis]|uniref:Diadenylate cyclase n=1 Tax=Shewanella xiamenensis TaxID=332186 RepID=A0AAE4Q5H5_9GAMM|nr:hypothetical protein [Shewanella xiamenensis]MDV5393033.1 diadenylate cyclase [Shewanella xiamenensis]